MIDKPDFEEEKTDKEEEEIIKKELTNTKLNEHSSNEGSEIEDVKKTKKKVKKSSSSRNKKSKETEKIFPFSAKKEDEDLEIKMGFKEENEEDKEGKLNADEIELPWFVKKEHVLN